MSKKSAPLLMSAEARSSVAVRKKSTAQPALGKTMGTLVTQAFILERYGPRLNTDEIAELLGISKPALYNQISAGTLRLKTYVEGGKRYADFRDAADYFDECRKEAV